MERGLPVRLFSLPDGERGLPVRLFSLPDGEHGLPVRLFWLPDGEHGLPVRLFSLPDRRRAFLVVPRAFLIVPRAFLIVPRAFLVVPRALPDGPRLPEARSDVLKPPPLGTLVPTMQRAVILSDLHLGPGGPLTTFRDHLALAGLFHRLADEAARVPTELVLAGDVFDFLQSDGYAGFDAAKAPDRLRAILAAPGNAGVFEQLAAFGAVRGAEITVLSGNHDPEMLLAPVREVFERAVKRPGSVRWADDDRPLRPREGDKWPLLGRAIGGARGQVWITHGDRWDPHNAIDRDAVRTAVAAGKPVALPPGSHFVFEVMAKLKPDNRWVDEMKPELPLVLPLLYYLDARRTKAVAAKHWRLTGELVRGVVMAALRAGDLFGEEQAPPPPRPQDMQRDLGGMLARELHDLSQTEREVLLAELSDVIDGTPARPPASDTLAAHGGVGRLLLRAWMAGIRQSERFQAEDGPDDIPYHAGPMLQNGVVGLVAGHTHGPRWVRDKHPAYVNTGTWIPVGSLPQGDVDAVIDALEAGRWEAHAPRSYAVVELGDGPPSIRLARCDERGAEVPR